MATKKTKAQPRATPNSTKPQPKKAKASAAPPSDEPAITFPRQVRITAKSHPHHGKTGTATGDVARPPGATQDMLLIELEGGQRCYADPLDLSLLDDMKALARRPGKSKVMQDVRKKLKPHVRNGGPAGNALDVDLLQNADEAVPLAEPPPAPPAGGGKGRKRRQPDSMCGATSKRTGQPCRHPAGFRTDHVGQGRCWLHGGRSPAPTGRYSSVRRPRFQQLLEEFQEDPDPLNLHDEVMLLRTLLADYIDRWEEQDAMLTRWNLSFEKAFQSAWAQWWRDTRANILEAEDDLTLEEAAAEMPDPMDFLPSKPLRMADITEAAGLIDKVGSMVDRIRKGQQGKTFDMATIDRLWTAMSAHLTQAMLEVIEDNGLRERLHASVAEKWSTISLAELASRGPEQSEGES